MRTQQTLCRAICVALLTLSFAFLSPSAMAQDGDDNGPAITPLLPGAGLPMAGPMGRFPGVPTELPNLRGDDAEDLGGSDVDDDEPPSRPAPVRRTTTTTTSTTSSSDGSATGGVSVAPEQPCHNAADVQARLNARQTLDYVEAPIMQIIEDMARRTCRNFIIETGLSGSITIISHREVTGAEAYQAFLSALRVMGYTTVMVGDYTKVIPVGNASNEPLRVYQGDSVEDIPYVDNYITQIFQLQNVSVSEVEPVVRSLSASANLISYQPTNTLIVTDSGVNIRRMWRIVSELDVASPTSSLRVIPIQHADASEIKRMIEELYGAAASESSSSSRSTDSTSSTNRRNRRNRRNRDRTNREAADTPTPASSSTTVGQSSSYISKMVADERTNSLVIMANDSAFDDIISLIERLDVDVDPSSRTQIHVVYLEHAKAEEVAQTLSNLTEDGRRQSDSRTRRNNTSNRNSRSERGGGTERGPRGIAGRDSTPESTTGASGGVTAVFEDGVRISSDENTNSLVIIASPESFAILRRVIERLDIRRKQVFVEAVILELASDDSTDMGIGFHMGMGDESTGGLTMGSGQFNATSFGLDSQSLLSGLAMGVFGEALDVAIPDGMGGSTTLAVPAFGVALNALQANSMVNILSTPNILTLDNEEAKIVVGRNIPFPVSSGLDANGNQLVSYQRQDVAITLTVTPQINESDFVTLEIFQEVAEIEEDSSGLDVTSAGFITSKRSAETTVLVRNNQTVVIGGLMGQTETEVETKVPILGDLPLIGALFRGRRTSSRKTNMLIVLTPHIIDNPEDLEEVYRVKVAQRNEFLTRFYGRSELEQANELNDLLQYSMNLIDEPSVYRTRIVESTQSIQTITGDEDYEPVVPEEETEVVYETVASEPDEDGPVGEPDTSEEAAASEEE